MSTGRPLECTGLVVARDDRFLTVFTRTTQISCFESGVKQVEMKVIEARAGGVRTEREWGERRRKWLWIVCARRMVECWCNVDDGQGVLRCGEGREKDDARAQTVWRITRMRMRRGETTV